jgi:hypothetical protein
MISAQKKLDWLQKVEQQNSKWIHVIWLILTKDFISPFEKSISWQYKENKTKAVCY